MKNISTFLLLLFASFLFVQCDFLSDSDKKESDSPDVEVAIDAPSTYSVLFADLVMPEEEGLFRGVEFDMTKEEVLQTEMAYTTTEVYKDEEEDELIITTDMGDEVLDFANITYSFDEIGLHYIYAETYTTSKEKSKYLYEECVEYYTDLIGEGYVADDGYMEYTREDPMSGYMYIVAFKEIDIEDSYGILLDIYITD